MAAAETTASAGALSIGMVAGEASGDLLGAELLGALQRRAGAVAALGVGGERMREAGMRLVASSERLSVMGLVEPLWRLPELLRLRHALSRRYRAEPPQVFVGIDAPDFNLGLERRLRQAGIPVAHYVSPSVWAWRAGRIETIGRSVDLMLTLFPFETRAYADRGIEALYVGHPLADRIPLEPDREAARAALGIDLNSPVIAVLPGSRRGEIARLAPLFVDACERCLRHCPELRFLVAAVDRSAGDGLRALLAQRGSGDAFELVCGQSHRAMAAADIVLTACGTATLEALLHKRPMVAAYRMAPLSHAVISRMLRTPWVALPNILAGEELVPELLQQAAQPEAIAAELLALLGDEARRAALQRRFAQIHRELRCGAADRAASAVLRLARRVSA